MEPRHYPVMSNEIIALLRDVPPGWLIDCTVGLGGHSRRILEELEHLKVLALDVDPDSLEVARSRLERWSEKVKLMQIDYAVCLDHPEVENKRISAVLVDPGISTMQMWDPERGFSHNLDAPLDMRKDRSTELTAAEVVNTFSEAQLSRIFQDYGEVRRAAELAKRIVETRLFGPIQTTAQLRKVVEKVFGSRIPRGKVHPAARVFQALRICVNRELEGVEAFIEKLPHLMAPGGRILFLTFHSLEDRMVKHSFRRLQSQGHLTLIRPFPMVPGEEEIQENPPSHSAKLRVAVVA